MTFEREYFLQCKQVDHRAGRGYFAHVGVKIRGRPWQARQRFDFDRSPAARRQARIHIKELESAYCCIFFFSCVLRCAELSPWYFFLHFVGKPSQYIGIQKQSSIQLKILTTPPRN